MLMAAHQQALNSTAELFSLEKVDFYCIHDKVLFLHF